ncbi:hypothetical protein IWQ61_010476 [Dispira simplex]|nr:hypothetical protein IWQ61_010476 [Dispira simplex]
MSYAWAGKLFVVIIVTLALLNSVHTLPADSTQQGSASVPTEAKNYKFTTYVSAFENEETSVESGEEEIHVCEGDALVDRPKLNKDFVNELKVLGSGRDKNGTWYNVVKPASKEHPNGCYAIVDFALGDSGEQLTVYTSAAIKGIKLGTLVEIEELKGTRMNANQEHNGCVKVTGNYAEKGNLNLWVYSAVQREEYFAEIPSIVTVRQGTGCKVQDYYYSENPNETIGKR